MNSLTKKTLGLTTQTWRRFSQFAFLFMLNPWVHRMIPGVGGPDVAGVCVPAMNCWSCPAAAFACPVGAVGQFLARGIIPFLAIGVMLLAGILLGRLFCGWVCPFGLLQDLMHKIPTRVKYRTPHELRWIKYVLLAVTVILIPLFFGVAPGYDRVSGYFFCSICPAGTLEATLPINFNLVLEGQRPLGEAVASIFGGVKFWILMTFLVGFVYFQRPFCKVGCPIGAFLGLFNKLSFFKFGQKRKTCSTCRVCRDVCPEIPDVDIQADKPDCIRCYICSPSPCQSRWNITTDSTKCKNCGLCWDLCPTGAMERAEGDWPRIAHPELCTGCGMCMMRCPEFGIQVTEDHEARAESCPDPGTMGQKEDA